MGERKQIFLFLKWSNWFKRFDARLLKTDKKDYNEIGIYYIGYVTNKKIADDNNIYSVNPLYLMKWLVTLK